MERWAAVPSFPCYEVSSLGEVRRSARGRSTAPGRPVKPFNKTGYWAVNLYCGEVRKTNYPVHRLIAEAFLGAGGSLHVNHIDGDKRNNRVENLEWVTRTENMQHASRTGLLPSQAGAANGRALVGTGIASAIRTARRLGRTYSELARLFGVSPATAWDVVKGRHWTHSQPGAATDG